MKLSTMNLGLGFSFFAVMVVLPGRAGQSYKAVDAYRTARYTSNSTGSSVPHSSAAVERGTGSSVPHSSTTVESDFNKCTSAYAASQQESGGTQLAKGAAIAALGNAVAIGGMLYQSGAVTKEATTSGSPAQKFVDACMASRGYNVNEL